MGKDLDPPAFARQHRLHRAALCQAAASLLCIGVALVGPTWSDPVASLGGFWQLSALGFYAAHTFSIYRLALAEGYSGRRAAMWLAFFAPFGSLVALVLLKPILSSHRERLV
jgi:hypothetical protein